MQKRKTAMKTMKMKMKMNAKQPRNECEPKSRAKHEE